MIFNSSGAKFPLDLVGQRVSRSFRIRGIHTTAETRSARNRGDPIFRKELDSGATLKIERILLADRYLIFIQILLFFLSDPNLWGRDTNMHNSRLQGRFECFQFLSPYKLFGTAALLKPPGANLHFSQINVGAFFPDGGA